ncbi:hypothetical protein EUX98_g3294 [Antrodiella citrinella]|uniref:GST C-terminal domain-containing protein n=1 Tax=Antrodiella citrinella TaxID=2447956 RepID=A0A4S4MWY7_9APHY|nr:hypothetical protein EUX98_g3294 [Antrodiella citrinella]
MPGHSISPFMLFEKIASSTPQRMKYEDLVNVTKTIKGAAVKDPLWLYVNEHGTPGRWRSKLSHVVDSIIFSNFIDKRTAWTCDSGDAFIFYSDPAKPEKRRHKLVIQSAGFLAKFTRTTEQKRADAKGTASFVVSSNVEMNTPFYNHVGFYTVKEFVVGDDPTWKKPPVVMAVNHFWSSGIDQRDGSQRNRPERHIAGEPDGSGWDVQEAAVFIQKSDREGRRVRAGKRPVSSLRLVGLSTLITRQLKGLEDLIDVTVVSPLLGTDGWPFADTDAYPGAQPDPLFKAQHIKDVYLRGSPDYEGRFTVPLLWDKKTNSIVNNESSEIIRMFNSQFNEQLPAEKAKIDIYPEAHRGEIDAQNEWVYDTVNNGVYKCGLSGTQKTYEKAVTELFESLDRLEKIVEGKEYLVGNILTEADVRFDPVYVGHFKANIRTIRGGYPNLHSWMRKLYWKHPAFKDTTNFDHIKTHYYWSHTMLNPKRIVPVGPTPHIEPL